MSARTLIDEAASTDAARTHERGLLFPRVEGARRATMATNQAVWADAARAVDPELGRRIDAARNWRADYLPLVGEVTVAGARSAGAATGVARAGLESLRSRLVFGRGGEERPLRAVMDVMPATRLGTETIEGAGEPVRELVVPYDGKLLRGDALRRQLDRWVRCGIIEPSAAAALGAVMNHPEWLALEGMRVVVLGAGAETSPLEVLASWGADVAALDLARPAIWRRLLDTARKGAGRVHFPVGDGARGDPAETAGANLICEVPEVAAWLRHLGADRPLVLGFYVYADGALHVQATAAADALTTDLTDRGHDVAVAYAGTPSDCYLVPRDVVEDSVVRRRGRGLRRALEEPLHIASGGRIYAPAYPETVRAEDGREWGVADGLVGRQGPNYALAKRLQRWRSFVAWSEGRPASFNVAPSTWTRSVTKNKLLAAGYYGARHVGMEVFAPDTMRTLMTALMVHDLHRPWQREPPSQSWHPDELVAHGAVHGGYWRRPYNLRTTLLYTAMLGLPQAYAPSLKR